MAIKIKMLKMLTHCKPKLISCWVVNSKKKKNREREKFPITSNLDLQKPKWTFIKNYVLQSIQTWLKIWRNFPTKNSSDLISTVLKVELNSWSKILKQSKVKTTCNLPKRTWRGISPPKINKQSSIKWTLLKLKIISSVVAEYK